MQNQWSEKTVELATTENYLDQLQNVYPHEEGTRNVPDDVITDIRNSFESEDVSGLLEKLLNLKKFPYKDSYVGFLRKDRTAIERNPQTVDRIYNRLRLMGIDKVIEGVTQPKEANTRRGNQFTAWVKDNFTMVGVKEFERSTNGIVVLSTPEKEAMEFCNKTLRVGLSKRPDIVAKVNEKYVIGEAKFSSSLGGNQDRGFDDGIKLVSNSDGIAIKMFLLDGVYWIETGSSVFKRIDHSSANIFSSLLMKDFLNDLK
jgi:hypothetical protein